ncbi:HalOD1 output domain-containing protein [Halovivax cerinus]|uniref:HalOD1 output domain-containing protein n=1 Tax=Halovivax cerinus TaxID=1487865 RepID=A0ABD5NS30_9EURY|nr:HalOD1 output domain-containing protein [Halovivax cerinus]
MGLSQHRPGATDVSLSHVVIETIAEREGIDVTELEPPAYPPLYSVVDPDALDTVFAPAPSGDGRSNGSVRFEYAGYTVTAYSDGRVELE